LNKSQKPITLLRSLIARNSPLSDFVFDFCSGSGSGSIAAASLGFSSISVDNRQCQIDGARERLKLHLQIAHEYAPTSSAFDFQWNAVIDEDSLPPPHKDSSSKRTPRKLATRQKRSELEEEVINLSAAEVVSKIDLQPASAESPSSSVPQSPFAKKSNSSQASSRDSPQADIAESNVEVAKLVGESPSLPAPNFDEMDINSDLGSSLPS
jgi:hypothetical protein